MQLSLGNMRGEYQILVLDECVSFWFERFITGARNRMEKIWKPNKGLSIELLMEMTKGVELRINLRQDPKDRHLRVVFHTCAVLSYIVSLRGPEGLLLDPSGLIRH